MEGTKSKNNLIALLHFIRDCELDKHLGKCNEELVDACVKLLLKLQNKSTDLTAEQVEDKVRKIPFVISADFNGNAKDNTNKKTKKHTTRKKILLVAAIIALLAMLMGIGYSISENTSIFEYITNKIGLENIEFGKIYNSNGISYEENKQSARYNNINDYPEENPYGILLPQYLPNDIESTGIIIVDDKITREIRVTFDTSSLVYNIYLDTKIPQATIDCCTELTVNNNKIYIMELLDVGTYQLYLEHNDNYYEISYIDKQELLKVIENMEE